MKNISGRFSLIRPFTFKGVAVERIEVHPGQGFRLIVVDSPEAECLMDAPAGSWAQWRFLSSHRERVLPAALPFISYK